VNKIRLVFAVVIYMILLTITTGRPFHGSQLGANRLAVAFRLIGLVIGDSADSKRWS